MTTLFTTLAILLLIMTVVFVIGSILAFRTEFEKAINILDKNCLDTEANYRKVKRSVEIISRNPFRNRCKTDELILLFHKKFKFSIYLDLKLDKAGFYNRLVKLTA
jgi:hypothetical protein